MSIRPATAGELQKTGPKKVKVDDPVAVPPASSLQEVAQPTPPPFPALLNARAGIEAVALDAMVKTSANLYQNMDTLITALKEGALQVDELGAAEIAVIFYPTKQVQAMLAMQQVLPSHCPLFISRYFALEQKGAAHVTALSSKVLTQGRLDEISLFRFLPLCINLQKLEV